MYSFWVQNHFVLPIEVNLKILLCFFSTYIYDGDVERVTKKATGSSEGGMVHETVERSLWIVCIIFYNAVMLYTPYLYWTQFSKTTVCWKISQSTVSAAFYWQFLESVPVNNLWYETRVRQIRDKWCLKLEKLGGSDTRRYK